MYMAFARVRGTSMDWQMVTNMGMPFSAEKGLMDLMIEKIQAKNPQNEYKMEEIKNANNA